MSSFVNVRVGEGKIIFASLVDLLIYHCCTLDTCLLTQNFNPSLLLFRYYFVNMGNEYYQNIYKVTPA